MQLEKRKLVTIVTEAAIEDEILRAVMQCGVHGYTVSDARGLGARGERSAGWQRDANVRIEMICSDSTADCVMTRLRDAFFENYAVVLWLSDVQVLRPEKF
jgi:nitrogen regulatory protein PII